MGLDMYLEKTNRVEGYDDAKDYSSAEMLLDYKAYLKVCKRNGEKLCSIEEYNGYSGSMTLEEAKAFTESYAPKIISFNSIWSEVGYWRKANQIHNWFVNNVQNGVDDCGRYEVTKDDLQKLLTICKKVNRLAPKKKVVPHFRRQGDKADWRRRTDILFLGRDFSKSTKLSPIAKKEIADLLPTVEGFFFGDTEYDHYYFDDITETIKTIENVLEEVDFEDEILTYVSSW